MDFCWIFADRKLFTVCSTKGAAYCSFRRALWNSYFGKVLLMNFASSWNKLFKWGISVNCLLMEVYVQGALWNVLHITPFVERFKIATLGRSCSWVLPVLRIIYSNIGFLWNFCWWKVMYRVLYERSCLLILS